MEQLSDSICHAIGGIKNVQITTTDLATFYDVTPLENTARYRRVRKRDGAGTTLEHTLNFTLVNRPNGLDEWLAEFAEADFLLLVTDFHDNTLKIGTADFPAEMLENFDTGEEASDLNAYELTFKATTTP